MTDKNYSLTVYESFNDLPSPSVKLLTESGTPFLDYDWFNALSTYVSYALGEPQWLVLDNGESTLAILPMVALRRGKYRVLHSMSNYYSPYYDIISSARPDSENFKTLVREAERLLRDFDVVEFHPMTREVANRCMLAFAHRSSYVNCYEYSTNWYESDLIDFETYWNARPSQLRTTIQRKQRNLEKLVHKFRIYSDDLTDSALADFHYVYYKSWKKNEPFPAFIDEIAKNSSRRNTLRLGILYIQDQPAAAQLWFVSQGTASIMKLAYDPEFTKLSVGSLLSHFMFKHVLDSDEVQRIDYLTGNDSYKAQWMSTARPLYGVEVFNTRTLWGATASLKHITVKILRRLLKNRHFPTL